MVSLIIIGLFYFAPAITAYSRGHSNASAITVLNLFAGWTGLGWIIAAVWCSTDNVRAKIAKA